LLYTKKIVTTVFGGPLELGGPGHVPRVPMP